MAKFRVELTLAAHQDIDGIAEYYLKKVGPVSAEKITNKLYEGLAALADFPEIGPEHPDPILARDGYRKLVIGEYVGVYRREGNIVYVYGVFHGSMNYPQLFV